MSSPQLTVDSQVPEDTAVTNPEPVPPPATSATSFLDNINWPLALAGAGLLLIIAAVVWQIASSRSNKKRPVKPRRHQAAKRARPTTAAKYCHECGQPLQAGDKFCRECGTAVKK